jgi:hypothetical protein
VKNAKTKAILIGFTAVSLVVCFHLLSRSNIPMHAGRPVSVWFQELCSGVYGGNMAKAGGFDAAFAAFSQMAPDAVPYLTSELHYDRFGIRQGVIRFLRRNSITKPYTKNLIFPLDRRCYAAVALRQMGPRAEAAIPSLLEAWAHDAPNVKASAVSALDSILHGTFLSGGSQKEWREHESAIIEEAGRRYPAVAHELGIGSSRIR